MDEKKRRTIPWKDIIKRTDIYGTVVEIRRSSGGELVNKGSLDRIELDERGEWQVRICLSNVTFVTASNPAPIEEDGKITFFYDGGKYVVHITPRH